MRLFAVPRLMRGQAQAGCFAPGLRDTKLIEEVVQAFTCSAKHNGVARYSSFTGPWHNWALRVSAMERSRITKCQNA